MIKMEKKHYNLISALHKSMRNSDPDAAIYWMLRMLEGGENPLYIARRLIRFASEDIGMADSHALQIAAAAYQACHILGMPECDVHLTHAVTYLSLAPKSNALYTACEDCKKDVRNLAGRAGSPADPQCAYPPDEGAGVTQKDMSMHTIPEEKLTHMQCMPDSLRDRRYYHPTKQGEELQVKKRFEAIQRMERGYASLRRSMKVKKCVKESFIVIGKEGFHVRWRWFYTEIMGRCEWSIL